MPFTSEISSSSSSRRHYQIRSSSKKNYNRWNTVDCDSVPVVARLPFGDNDDTVGFSGIDDSNESFMHFASPAAAAALPAPLTFDDSDSMDWDIDGGPSGASGQPVVFRSSPSEPARCLTARVLAISDLARLASAPVQPQQQAAASGDLRDSQRASYKRPSPFVASPSPSSAAGAAADFFCEDANQDADGDPDLQNVEGLQSQQRAAAGTTPKRRRTSRPLGDLTNNTALLPVAATGPSSAPAVFKKLHRCVSEVTWDCHGNQTSPSVGGALDSARVDRAIASIDSLNLIGNSEQQHSLPTVKELDYGIRHVTGATVSRLVNGGYTGAVSNYAIVDCRYPFEFAGGHIQGAINIYTQEDLLQQIFNPVCDLGPTGTSAAATQVLIFHCEFSSERAPKLARFLRQRDREANAMSYPDLYFPEVYVLQGGYKAFFEAHVSDCHPANYVRMADPVFKAELSHYQRTCKAWERQNSRNRHTQLERLAASARLF